MIGSQARLFPMQHTPTTLSISKPPNKPLGHKQHQLHLHACLPPLHMVIFNASSTISILLNTRPHSHCPVTVMMQNLLNHVACTLPADRRQRRVGKCSRASTDPRPMLHHPDALCDEAVSNGHCPTTQALSWPFTAVTAISLSSFASLTTLLSAVRRASSFTVANVPSLLFLTQLESIFHLSLTLRPGPLFS